MQQRTSFLLVTGFLAIAACAKQYQSIEPVVTTYPRDRVEERTTRVWIAPGVKTYSRLEILPGFNDDGSALFERKSDTVGQPTLDFRQQIKGDSGIIETYILPNQENGRSEESLLRRVDHHGRQTCGGDFRTVDLRYYFGGEATVQMAGIQSNALKAVYRCPVNSDAANPRERSLRSAGGAVHDIRYFDYLEFRIEDAVESINLRIRAVLESRGMPIIEEKTVGTSNIIIAGAQAFPPLGFGVHETAAVMLEGSNGVTVLGIILATNYTVRYTRGVLNRATPKVIGVGPIKRDRAYERTKQFVGQIMEKNS